jgi:hypothetical protein
VAIVVPVVVVCLLGLGILAFFVNRGRSANHSKANADENGNVSFNNLGAPLLKGDHLALEMTASDVATAPGPFHPETGFPQTAEGEATVARMWRDPKQSDNGFAVQLPHTLLDDATMHFSEMRCIGGGGSCKVYRADVFGVPVAVKALKDKSLSAGETHR